MIIDGTGPSAQGTRIPDLSRESKASYPQMELAADTLALDLVSFVADSKRQHIGAREHGIHFNVAAIDTAGYWNYDADVMS